MEKTSPRKIAKAHIAVLRQREAWLRAAVTCLGSDASARQRKELAALTWACEHLRELAQKAA